MNSRRDTLTTPGLVLLLVILISGLSVVNFRLYPKYTVSDSFLDYYVGTRLLLTEGVSPFSDEGKIRVQDGIRKISGAEQSLQDHPVIYPLYAGSIFLPFALIENYPLARAIWMTALEIALITLALVSLRVTRWRIRGGVLLFYLLFSFLWFHSVAPLIAGDVVILVAVFIVLALLAIRSGYDEVAGLLLALSTIKPLVVWLVVLLIILWALSQRRWKVLFWFFGSLALLIIGMMFFVQNWPLQYVQMVVLYLRDASFPTTADLLRDWLPGVGARLGWILTGLLGAILIVEWYIIRGKKEFHWFLWTACLTLVVGQMIGFYTGPSSFIVLLLPLVEVFSVLEERWKLSGRIVSSICMALLLVLPWSVYFRLLNHGGSLEQLSNLLFPLPLLLIIGLYWTRWWAIRPRRMYIDALREAEES